MITRHLSSFRMNFLNNVLTSAVSVYLFSHGDISSYQNILLIYSWNYWFSQTVGYLGPRSILSVFVGAVATFNYKTHMSNKGQDFLWREKISNPPCINFHHSLGFEHQSDDPGCQRSACWCTSVGISTLLTQIRCQLQRQENHLQTDTTNNIHRLLQISYKTTQPLNEAKYLFASDII